MGGLHDADIVLWSAQQSRLLRRLGAGEHINEQADWDNLAEEIEAFGKSQTRELASRIATILEHLIKLQASPARDPRAGWRGTIRRERREVERLLADAPSLRRTLPAVVAEELPAARAAVLEDLTDRGEAAKVDLADLTIRPDQVLGDWFPG
jgi:Domain of unknown function DUF29